jgi:hypothetical protein
LQDVEMTEYIAPDAARQQYRADGGGYYAGHDLVQAAIQKKSVVEDERRTVSKTPLSPSGRLPSPSPIPWSRRYWR